MATKFTELSIDERIELVGDLWDSIVADQAELALTDEQRQELDYRLDAFAQNPERGKLVDDVLKDIRGRS